MVANGNAPRHNPRKPGKGLVGDLPFVGCRVAVLHNVSHMGHEDDILLFGILPNPLRLIVKVGGVFLGVELSVRQHDDRKRFLVSGRAASKSRQGGKQKGAQQARIHVHISLSCQSRRRAAFWGNSTETCGPFRNKTPACPYESVIRNAGWSTAENTTAGTLIRSLAVSAIRPNPNAALLNVDQHSVAHNPVHDHDQRIPSR